MVKNYQLTFQSTKFIFLFKVMNDIIFNKNYTGNILSLCISSQFFFPNTVPLTKVH